MSGRRHLDSSFNAITTIGHMIQPLITSKAGVKCVDSEGEHRFIRDAVLLLNQVDIQHPVGQYIVSVCNGFMNQYKTGGDTLLYFICQWTKAASLLCEMGLPISTIIALLRETVRDCVDHAEKHKIDIDKLMQESEHNEPNITNENTVVEDTKVVEDSSELNSKHALSTQCLTLERMTDEMVQDEFIEVMIGKTCTDTDKVTSDKTVLERNQKYLSDIARVSDALEPCKSMDLHKDLGKKCRPRSTQITYNESLESTSDLKGMDNQKKDSKAMLDDKIMVINLKMKNILDDRESFNDEEDEFAWFFTADSKDENQINEEVIRTLDSERTTEHNSKSTSCIYNEESAQNYANNIHNALIASSVLHDALSDCSENESDLVTEDSDTELIRDINDLKKGIETDLEILKRRSRTNGTGVKSTFIDRKQESSSEDEFDESFHLSKHSELKNHNMKQERDMDGFYDETSEFVTVQFTLNSDMKKPQVPSLPDIKASKAAQEKINTDLPVDTLKINTDPPVVVKHDQNEAPDLKVKKVPNVALSSCKTVNDDLKVLGTLLKSMGKDTKPLSLSGKVLNNSRHFRTLQSVCKQKTDNHSDIPDNDDAFINTDLGPDDKPTGQDVDTTQKVDSRLDLIDLHSQSDGKVTPVSEENENCYTKNIKSTSVVSTSSKHVGKKLVTPGKTFKEDLLNTSVKSTEVLGKTCHSLSDMNHLLSQLASYRKQSAEKSSESRKVSAAVSVRSRHLNIDSVKVEDMVHQAGDLYNLSPVNDKLKCNHVKAAISLRSRHLNTDSDQMACLPNKISSSDKPSDIVRDSTEKVQNVNTCPHTKMTFDRTESCSQHNEPRNNYPSLGKAYSCIFKESENCLHDIGLNNTDTDTLNTASSEPVSETETKSGRLIKIVEGILDRADVTIVTVICQIVSRLESQGCLSMIEKLVDCYPVLGSKIDIRLVHGLVIKTSLDCVGSVQKLSGRPCRVLLVNADITPTFKHKGYKSSEVSTVYTVNSFRSHVSQSENWVQQVINVLKKLSVDVILARGQISDEMMSVCGNLNIVAIETVSYRQLKLISDITETDMATYIKLATEDNVCSGVSVSQLHSDVIVKNVFNTDSVVTGEMLITLQNNNPQTVVLSGITSVLVDLKEQEFWESLHQVTSSLQTGFLLPGNAQTEFLCVEYLRTRKELFLKKYREMKQSDKHFISVVYETIEQTFQNYFDSFHHLESSSSDSIYDNYASKVGAWKVACDTVCTILNLDSYIITGITSEMEARDKQLIHTLL